jgi:hypothetical protein
MMADVDDLVRNIARGEVSLWQELNDAAERSQGHLSNFSRFVSRRNDFEFGRASAQSSDTADRLAKLNTEHQELLSFTQQLAKLFVESSSTKELNALPEVVLATLIALSDS